MASQQQPWQLPRPDFQDGSAKRGFGSAQLADLRSARSGAVGDFDLALLSIRAREH